MSNLSYIVGSRLTQNISNDLRVIKTDNLGRIETVPLITPIYGVAGDGVTLNPFRQVDFRPQFKDGTKTAFGAASVAIGPLDILKTYHIFATAICWLNKGGAAVVAFSMDTAIQAGPVYEYVPTAVGVDDYIAVIEDVAGGGDIFISRVED